MGPEGFLGAGPGIFMSITYKDCQTWRITVIHKELRLWVIPDWQKYTCIFLPCNLTVLQLEAMSVPTSRIKVL